MSIRMTRQEYVGTLQQRRRRVTVADVAKLLVIRMKQSLKRQGVLKETPKKLWAWALPQSEARPGVTMQFAGKVEAHTRSEARAEIKKALGIKKGRLPIGVEIYEAVPRRDRAA